MTVVAASFIANSVAALRRGHQQEAGHPQERQKAKDLYTLTDRALAEDENELLTASYAEMVEAVAFQPRPGFIADGSTAVKNIYTSAVERVRQRTADLASRNRAMLVDGLGLEMVQTTNVDEIERHLHALDMLERALVLGLESGVRRGRRVEIDLDPAFKSRRGLGAIERTKVSVETVSTADAVTRWPAMAETPLPATGEGGRRANPEPAAPDPRSRADPRVRQGRRGPRQHHLHGRARPRPRHRRGGRVMNVRKEPIVFLLVAAALGYKGLELYKDSGTAGRPPKPRALDYESVGLDDLSLVRPEAGRGIDFERNLFAPPSATSPLPPLSPELPPFAALPALGPPTAFGPEPRWFSDLLREPASPEAARQVPGLFDVREAPVEVEGEVLEIATGDEGAELPDDPEARAARIAGLKQQYDWIYTNGFQFGRILNEDRYRIEFSPESPLLFTPVNPATGVPLYPKPIEYGPIACASGASSRTR